MRIAIVTESFAPDVNGVANSVLRIAEQLIARDHEILVIAPESGKQPALPYQVLRVPSMALPGYPTFRIGLPSRRIRHELARFQPDVVHLASPVALGAYGGTVARSMQVPVVAVFQTDLPSYAREYRLSVATQAFAWRWLRGIHNGAARTLAPSSPTATELTAHGIERVWLWGRGVDTGRFRPELRSDALRAKLAPNGEVLVGYVGRLAVEKRVDLLAPVAELKGVKLVIVGDGPAAEDLRRAMPSASFLGELRGLNLAATYASLDVFAHSGPHETFGQTLQEAAASGLPVVAPARGGPLDIVTEDTGFLYPPCDSLALTEAVARLVRDPELRAAQGQAARARMQGRTWDALTTELEGHYHAVIEREPKAAALPGLRSEASALRAAGGECGQGSERS
jgi:phosphatidylinositol alpha 1,6-mannosyltransferase